MDAVRITGNLFGSKRLHRGGLSASMTKDEIITLLKKALFDEKSDFWEIMTQIKRELEND